MAELHGGDLGLAQECHPRQSALVAGLDIDDQGLGVSYHGLQTVAFPRESGFLPPSD